MRKIKGFGSNIFLYDFLLKAENCSKQCFYREEENSKIYYENSFIKLTCN